jgi:branched-chain amino acid transport system substrate-binding protein
VNITIKITIVAFILIILGTGIILIMKQKEPETYEHSTIKNSIFPSGEVKVGLIFPITGDLSGYGAKNIQASKLAIQDFNKYLLEQGYDWRIKGISHDSATNPEIAYNKINKLNADGIKIIVGPETSENVHHVKEYAKKNNMILISCCSSAPSLVIDDHVFRLVPDDTNQGKVLATLLQDQGIETIIPVWRNDAWGTELKEELVNSFNGNSDDGIRYEPDTVVFSLSAQTLSEKIKDYAKNEPNNVAIVYIGFGEITNLIDSLSNHDIFTETGIRWYGTDGVSGDPDLAKSEISKFLTDVNFTTVRVAVDENPTSDRIRETLIDENSSAISNFAYSSYDAVWLIGLSMIATNSTDASLIRSNFHYVAENYANAAIGSIGLNEEGDLKKADYEVLGLHDSKWISFGKYVQDDKTKEWKHSQYSQLE